MSKALLYVACVVVAVLAVSVWRQLEPATQEQILMLWTALVRLLAEFVEWLVAALMSA